jgi:hypothetical protein
VLISISKIINNIGKKIQIKSLKAKEKAIISDGLSSFAPPIGESYNFNAMISFITIRKLKG